MTGARYLVPATAVLAVGGMVAGAKGLVIAGVLIVVATPIVGFTCNQIALTVKGRRLATTVDEVRSLKESDAAAFTQPIAIVLRRPSAGETYSIGTSLPQAVGQNVELRRPTALKVWRGESGVNALSGTTREQPHPVRAPHDGAVLDDRSEFIRSTAPNFWESLVPTEQRALEAVAQTRTFAAGTALCRQSEPAGLVFVISSGFTKVYVAQHGGRRIIAIRGPGDIIGERAAFQARSRSATVVAIDSVQALVIPTADFAVFLGTHPRVLEVLERGLYDRLTEDPEIARGRQSATADVVQRWRGQNCSIFLTDITAFGGQDRNDGDRMVIRDEMYAILRDVFEESEVPWSACHREDRGDGALIVVPPDTPTRSLVDPLLAQLAIALRCYNRRATHTTRMQLRVAMNVGPVVSDPQGVSGEAIILTARILDAPILKKELARTAANLGVIVSAFIYESVIKHAPGCVDPAQYRQLRFRVKESNLNAWMYLAGRLRLGLTAPAVARSGPGSP